MKNRKSRVLKAMGLSSLALVMGAIGTLAFAPLNLAQISSASEAEMTTEQGLITPKADDPVIYTTESGLEIKFGNATVANGGGNETIEYDKMTSGNLNGFPYFTTKNGSTTYTWVIIGKSTTMPSNVVSQVYDTLTNWRNKTAESPTYKNFFDNSYEETTPAGAAIKNNNILNDQTARKLTNTLNAIASIKATDEIPANSVLALANAPTTKCYFSTSSTVTSADYIFAGASNPLRTTCANYYTNDTFGFGTLKSSLQSITLKQLGIYYTGSTQYRVEATTNLHFFPLDMSSCNYLHSNGTYYNYTNNNFKYLTYLTNAQYGCGYQTWLRTLHYQTHPYYTNTDGTSRHDYLSNLIPANNTYARPACVLKLT